jgi:hypothetical protein
MRPPAKPRRTGFSKLQSFKLEGLVLHEVLQAQKAREAEEAAPSTSTPAATRPHALLSAWQLFLKVPSPSHPSQMSPAPCLP